MRQGHQRIRNKYLIFMIVLIMTILVFTVHNAFALNLNFGSDIDTRVIVLSPGQRGGFQLSFVNPGDAAISVHVDAIDAESFEPLKVSVIADTVVIPGIQESLTKNPLIPGPGKWYILDDGITHIPIYNSYIYVEAPFEIYQDQLHDYVLTVDTMAALYDPNNALSIKENIAQNHEYKLTVKLSQEFENHIKHDDEGINLNFNKKWNKVIENQPLSQKNKNGLDEPKNDEQHIYYNNEDASLLKNQNVNGVNESISGDIISPYTKDNEYNTEDGAGSRTGASTIVVIIVCAIALILAMRM